LDATASVPGTFSYSPASGVLNVGSYVLSVTFTPTDSSDYTTASGSVTLTVTKATPAITWATPAAIIYGTPLSASQLDATASVPGTFSYSPASGVLNAGSYVLSVLFTPTDSSDYTTASGSVALVVMPAVLTVTANSVSMPFGTTPALEATISGFVNGDSQSVVSGAPALATPANTLSLPGIYPITAGLGTLSAANYTFTFVGGTYTVTFTDAAPSTGTLCNGAYSGTFSGNITVSSGQVCVFVGGAINGNVKLNSGNLMLIQSQVTGNVQLNGGGTFTIGPGSTITGNLQIQNLPSGSVQNQVCGTTVSGNLQFQNNGTAVLIGSASAPPCPGNTIGGNLQVQNNTAPITIVNNTVNGNLQVQNNTADTTITGNTVNGNLQDDDNNAPTAVFTNTVGKNLQCNSNTSITGGGNTAGKKQDQCSSF